MLTKQQTLDLAIEWTEDRVKNLTLSIWLDNTISGLIHEKHWWWRKKTLIFNSVVGTQQYDLSDVAIADADDFEEMINLSRVVSGVDAAEIKYRSDAKDVQSILHTSTSGTPANYILVPGSPKLLRFDYKPGAAESYRGLYWAGFNSLMESGGDEPIPLIPENYHYVVLERFLVRIFQYLFGQNDPRYISQVKEADNAYAQLCRFSGPGLERIEMRSADPDNYVRATS